MTTVVSVLCARVRMEEKWLIEALAQAGVPARPLSPALPPLKVGPVPTGPISGSALGGTAAGVDGIVLDRCVDRVVAGAIVPALRAAGVHVIDAGLASTGNRFTVAAALTAAGLPRPETMLVASEDAGIAAVKALGFPATILPLDSGAREISLWDIEIAEATLEHRAVLGSSHDVVALIQAGARSAGSLSLLVVGGRVIGVDATSNGTIDHAEAFGMAESAATVLGAGLVGIDIVKNSTGLVVWDAKAVPDFRAMSAIGNHSIASAIAAFVERTVADESAPQHAQFGRLIAMGIGLESLLCGEVRDGVALSA